MPSIIKSLIGAARITKPWEYGYFGFLLITAILALASDRLGIPRLLAGFMALIVVLMSAGGFFIIDNVRTRWEHRPAHLR
jgi:hypothetical protein